MWMVTRAMELATVLTASLPPPLASGALVVVASLPTDSHDTPVDAPIAQLMLERLVQCPHPVVRRYHVAQLHAHLHAGDDERARHAVYKALLASCPFANACHLLILWVKAEVRTRMVHPLATLPRVGGLQWQHVFCRALPGAMEDMQRRATHPLPRPFDHAPVMLGIACARALTSAVHACTQVMAACTRVDGPSCFVGQPLMELVSIILRLPAGGVERGSALWDEYDKIMAGLNFWRFLLLSGSGKVRVHTHVRRDGGATLREV